MDFLIKIFDAKAMGFGKCINEHIVSILKDVLVIQLKYTAYMKWYFAYESKGFLYMILYALKRYMENS